MAPLKGLVISAAGDIGPGKGNDQLRKWVEANGGRWTPRVGKGITHLISSKDAYKKNAEAVQQAKKLGAFIVSYDWLEDCLQGRRRLAERKYTWEVQRTQRRNAKQMKRLGPQADTKKFVAGCELAKKDLGSGTSKKSSSRSGGFFSGALDDLRKKREAREAEERAKQAEAADASRAQEITMAATEDDAVSSAQPIKSRSAPKTTSSAPKIQPQPQRQRKIAPSEPAENIQSASPPPSASKGTPAPSVFPPCVKYTPPSSSSQPAPTPTPTAPVQPNPAEIKFSDLYHIYLDDTGFEYKLILLRCNPYLNNFARYDLRLYESHTKPHVYCTKVRYMPPAGASSATAAGVFPTASTTHPTTTLSATLRAELPLAQPPASTTTPPDPQTAQAAQAAHLQSLITPPTPSPNLPYQATLVPLSSPFAPAFRAFRHVFHDLTLLPWTSRLDTALQRLRAQALCIEPFVWRRPAEGLPTGVMPCVALPELDREEGYSRNAWGLPGLDVGLGREGAVGSALFREAEEGKRREEERRRREEALVKGRAGSVGVGVRGEGGGRAKAKAKTAYKGPLFNAVNGVPRLLEQQYQQQQQRQVTERPTPTATATASNLTRNTPASTPVQRPGTGRAVFLDYRTKAQKRAAGSYSGRFEY